MGSAEADGRVEKVGVGAELSQEGSLEGGDGFWNRVRCVSSGEGGGKSRKGVTERRIGHTLLKLLHEASVVLDTMESQYLVRTQALTFYSATHDVSSLPLVLRSVLSLPLGRLAKSRNTFPALGPFNFFQLFR